MEKTSKLDLLRQQVAEMFDNAEEKETIEKLATINNTIDEVSKEQDEIVSKNAELIKDYKTLVQHTSFKIEGAPIDTVNEGQIPSFEDALASFMAKKGD